MTVSILTGDCIDEMRKMPNGSIDAIVTDPPYGISFMNKGWDKPTGEEWGYFTGSGVRPSANESRDFQQRVYYWSLEMERVLKPGGYLLAFGGTRTYHRLASGIEDAGFEIRDCISWVYGSGFPKSLNLAGGLGTALKPAHEPIVVARKRLIGTVAANVAAHGTGALNVDASRVAVEGGSPAAARRANAPAPSLRQDEREASGRPLVDRTSPERYGEARDGEARDGEAIGRWPPNLVLSHDPECVEDGRCAEDCAVAEMDRQSGNLTSGDNCVRTKVGSFLEHGGLGKAGDVQTTYGDSGGASRFFPVFRYEAKPSRAERDAGLEARAPQRGGAEQFDSRWKEGVGEDRAPKVRNTHPTVKPIALMAWLVQLVAREGMTVLDPFLGSGTTAIACARVGVNCIGIEREAEYVEIARARIRGDAPLFSS